MNDYDQGFYIDEEPPEGSGDEDNREDVEYSEKEIKELRERLENCALLKVQAS